MYEIFSFIFSDLFISLKNSFWRYRHSLRIAITKDQAIAPLISKQGTYFLADSYISENVYDSSFQPSVLPVSRETEKLFIVLRFWRRR